MNKINQRAKELHDFYETRSIINKWHTQERCQVEFEDLPPENKQTMIDLASFTLEKEENLTILIREYQSILKEVELETRGLGNSFSTTLYNKIWSMVGNT